MVQSQNNPNKEMILELYRGDIRCQDIPGYDYQKSKDLLLKMVTCQKRVEELVPKEHREKFQEMCENHYLLDEDSAEQAYAQGFITGLRLAVEALYGKIE